MADSGDLVGVLVEVVVEYCCANVPRNICYQDEPGPENNTGPNIIRLRAKLNHIER